MGGDVEEDAAGVGVEVGVEGGEGVEGVEGEDAGGDEVAEEAGAVAAAGEGATTET